MILQTTEMEQVILKTLHEKIADAKKLIGTIVTKQHFKIILMQCNILNFPLYFADKDPVEMSNACKSLKEKGLVKEFAFEGSPVLIPISGIYYSEVTILEITQKDIDQIT